MKKTKSTILIILIAFLLVGCSSDDDNQSTSSIIGTFLSTSIVIETFLDGVSQRLENEVIDENNFSRITFNSDGTFSVFVSESFESNGQEQVSTETITGVYFVEENFLTITQEGLTEQAMFTLNDNILTIIFTDESTFNGETIAFVTTSMFTRQ